MSLPIRLAVILEEFSPHVLAGVEATMIGSTIRAAPSTMSSGGWNDCRRALRAARGAGSSLVTQPVSTAFMWMPSA